MTQSWFLAALGLIPPLFVAAVASGTGAIHQRLIAVQLTAALSVLLLMALTFALDQASSIDLALTLALLGLPGTLLFAVFAERWL